MMKINASHFSNRDFKMLPLLHFAASLIRRPISLDLKHITINYLSTLNYSKLGYYKNIFLFDNSVLSTNESVNRLLKTKDAN